MSPPTAERRPSDRDGVPEDRAGQLTDRVPPRAPVPLSDVLPDVVRTIAAADPRAYLWAFDSGRAVGDAEGFRRGHIEGHARGRADGRAEALAEVEAREAAAHARLVRSVADRAARAVPYATLCERRGEPDRAARQRQILRERGIWPPAVAS